MNALYKFVISLSYICDEILSGKFESNLSRIPPNSDQSISAHCIFKE
jgi:hypothetical protein